MQMKILNSNGIPVVCVYVSVAVGLLITGEGLGFVSFVTKYPSVLVQLITFSLCSAIGQVSVQCWQLHSVCCLHLIN